MNCAAPLRAMALATTVLLLVGACSTTPERAKSRASLEKAAQINAQLGANYLNQGDLQRANEKLQKALRQDSGNADAHATFALLQMRLDKPDKANDHFERALDLDPDNPGLQNNYGTFLCGEGKYEAGIEQFLRAADNQLYGTPEYAYANAGRCARDAGRIDEADEYLRQALEENPRLPSALFDLASLELERGKPRQAQSHLQRYHEIAVPAAQTLWLGVRIERALGNAERARSHGMKLLRGFPDSVEADRFLETR